MDERLRQTVRERADHRCEYCCLRQEAEPFFAYHVEHIVARQHGGTDDNANLALAPRRSLLPLCPKRTQVRLKSLLQLVWRRARSMSNPRAALRARVPSAA